MLSTFEIPEPGSASPGVSGDVNDSECLSLRDDLKRFRNEYSKPVQFRCVVGFSVYSKFMSEKPVWCCKSCKRLYIFLLLSIQHCQCSPCMEVAFALAISWLLETFLVDCCWLCVYVVTSNCNCSVFLPYATDVVIQWLSVTEVHGWWNKLGGLVGDCFFLQTISHDWEDLRTSNLAKRWHLVRGWCAHLDFWRKLCNCGATYTYAETAYSWWHHASGLIPHTTSDSAEHWGSCDNSHFTCIVKCCWLLCYVINAAAAVVGCWM